MTWTWDLDTFGAHWFNAANDRMPDPLRYLSRFPTLEGLHAHRTSVRAALSTDECERIDLLMHTVSRCDLRIEIIGSTTRHYRGDGRSRKQYRLVGARTSRHAVVLFQTALHDEFSDIRADLLRAEDLPTALAAAIPPCDPGTARPETFHLGDTEPAQRAAYLSDDSRNSGRARFQRYARSPVDGGGHAVLRLGNYHARPERHRFAQWRDITDDGRYLEQRNDTHIEIRPAASRLLGELFGAWVERAVRQVREMETRPNR